MHPPPALEFRAVTFTWAGRTAPALNGVSLQRGVLRIVKGEKPKAREIVTGPRIGITQAIDWPLRFYLDGSPWVSR